MPSYLEILKSLPPIEEEAEPALSKYMIRVILLCVITLGLVLACSWYVKSIAILYVAIVPLSLIAVAVIAYVTYEVRSLRKMLAEREHSSIAELDQRIEREKTVVGELAKLSLAELKWMTQRLEMEAVIRERWLDVLKPYSMLVPAVLIIVSVNIFQLPALIQDLSKLFGAALLAGLMIGAIAIYNDIVHIRRLAPIVHCAIAEIEGKRAPSFRKISRRRGQP